MKTKKYVVLAVGAVLVGLLTIAASDKGHGQNKLGGAWIGKGAGSVWSCVQTPLNPQAVAAVLRVEFQAYDATLAGLAAAFGADTLSDFVGQAEMISRDTDRWTLVGYAQGKGVNNELEIRAIVVAYGTFQFVDPNHAKLQTTLTVYLASADADGDGMPDPGTTPVITIPNIPETAQRVPILK